MISLNKIMKASGRNEIKTRIVYYDDDAYLAERHAIKYNLTWESNDPDSNIGSYGQFKGSIDNILRYYENELDMENDGIYEIIELFKINNLDY